MIFSLSFSPYVPENNDCKQYAMHNVLIICDKIDTGLIKNVLNLNILGIIFHIHAI